MWENVNISIVWRSVHAIWTRLLTLDTVACICFNFRQCLVLWSSIYRSWASKYGVTIRSLLSCYISSLKCPIKPHSIYIYMWCLTVMSIISVYESNDTLCDRSNIVVFVHWLMCKPHDKYRLWFQPYFKYICFPSIVTLSILHLLDNCSVANTWCTNP